MKSTFPYATAHRQINDRRLFISNMLKASLASAFIFSAGETNARVFFSIKKSYTVGDIMDMILKEIPGAPFAETVDTLKSGNREMVVTGIVTTMFTTVDIIHQAIKAGANFIIAHEPTFYNHTDDTAWVTPNHIVKLKQDLLEKNKITVWRCHDYLHSFVPDGVQYGVVQKMNWVPYFKTGSPVINIPQVSLGDLAQQLKTKLNIEHVRVIGKLSQKCERIALLPGASGGKAHLSVVEKERPDVLIVGEVHEWETAEYIRDTQQLGEKTSLVVLGHSVSEEPGLQWLQEWLQSKVQDLKVTHIVSGNPFTWV
ncbi:MAG: Nif3-like dinuclear metal center hexameric protein [Bacteroidota bacterium]